MSLEHNLLEIPPVLQSVSRTFLKSEKAWLGVFSAQWGNLKAVHSYKAL